MTHLIMMTHLIKESAGAGRAVELAKKCPSCVDGRAKSAPNLQGSHKFTHHPLEYDGITILLAEDSAPLDPTTPLSFGLTLRIADSPSLVKKPPVRWQRTASTSPGKGMSRNPIRQAPAPLLGLFFCTPRVPRRGRGRKEG